ncbi:MAG: hypothetical protein DYH20_15770 [Gammaproteobacteria bacterium PRO9]|nr:hypothetical protein [Gammaproteobacteria bacterium PRO9]
MLMETPAGQSLVRDVGDTGYEELQKLLALSAADRLRLADLLVAGLPGDAGDTSGASGSGTGGE